MNLSGPNFKLVWAAPPDTDHVTQVNIYEKVGNDFTIVANVPAPATEFDMANVSVGDHAYFAKGQNAVGESADFSDEVDVTVINLPGTIQSFAFALQTKPAN